MSSTFAGGHVLRLGRGVIIQICPDDYIHPKTPIDPSQLMTHTQPKQPNNPTQGSLPEYHISSSTLLCSTTTTGRRWLMWAPAMCWQSWMQIKRPPSCLRWSNRTPHTSWMTHGGSAAGGHGSSREEKLFEDQDQTLTYSYIMLYLPCEHIDPEKKQT